VQPSVQPVTPPAQPTPAPQPAALPPEQPLSWSQPVAQAPQPGLPQTPSSYAAPQSFDAHYLDSIAPPPPKAKFLSGAFGKIFFALMGLFVLAVSLIVAFSGQDKTADLQQLVVRLEHTANTAKTVHKHLKSTNLTNINSTYQIWLAGNKAEGEELLKLGGVKKTDYSKKMVADEKAKAEELDKKFEDARLSARLNRVYAASMAAETEKLITTLDTMGKKSSSQKIRDYAKNASKNLTQIQKDFEAFSDDGN